MKRAENITAGSRAAFTSWRTAGLTATTSILALLGLALSTNIEYSLQMIGGGFTRTAIENRLVNLYVSNGITGTFLSITYSVAIGVAVSNLYLQLKNGTVELKGLAGALPGFAAAGCAGCGVGLMAFIGLAGSLSFLPFQGNSLRIAAVLLIAYYLSSSGDPRKCEASVNYES